MVPSYPNFKNKHLEIGAIINADYSGEEAKKFKGKIPTKCIITYQTTPFNHFFKILGKKLKPLTAKTLWGCEAFYTKDFVLVRMKGVGAPHATLMFEELIALGIKEFINMGICGGLQKPGFYICNKAIRDEGTSQHYIPHAKYASADKKMIDKLISSCKSLKIPFEEGKNWTIDAAFRETKAEVKKYKKEGVKTVDMEVSALYSVAKLRKVKIAAIFFTSDIILVGEWKPMHYNDPDFVNKNLRKLSEVGIDCFTK